MFKNCYEWFLPVATEYFFLRVRRCILRKFWAWIFLLLTSSIKRAEYPGIFNIEGSCDAARRDSIYVGKRFNLEENARVLMRPVDITGIIVGWPYGVHGVGIKLSGNFRNLASSHCGHRERLECLAIETSWQYNAMLFREPNLEFAWDCRDRSARFPSRTRGAASSSSSCPNPSELITRNSMWHCATSSLSRNFTEEERRLRRTRSQRRPTWCSLR